MRTRGVVESQGGVVKIPRKVFKEAVGSSGARKVLVGKECNKCVKCEE